MTSDDPILAVRRGVYEVSVAHRTGGWKGRLAALNEVVHPLPFKKIDSVGIKVESCKRK